MKKSIGYTLLVLFVSAIVLSSCKSHERCPAYTKAVVKSTEKSI